MFKIYSGFQYNIAYVIGQSVQVRPLQFPMQHVQQTVPVQVPVTASNGQTIYQTVHFPVQALSSVFNVPATQMIPQITQVCWKSTNKNYLTLYLLETYCWTF